MFKKSFAPLCNFLKIGQLLPFDYILLQNLISQEEKTKI